MSLHGGKIKLHILDKGVYEVGIFKRVAKWIYWKKIDLEAWWTVRQMGYKSLEEFKKSCDDDPICTKEETDSMYADIVRRLKENGVWSEE